MTNAGRNREPLIMMEGVSKTYVTATNPICALTNVSVNVTSGEILSIIGTNGSGKSTLLAVAGGLLQPEAGVVRLDGLDVSQSSLRRLATLRGIMYQQPARNLCVSFTLAEMITAYAGPRDLELDDLRLTLRRLAVVETRRISSMSGGQQQLFALELILARRPSVILLDEPTAALDVRNARLVRERVRTAAGRGMAVMFVSHNIDEAVAIADRLVFLHEGVVVRCWSRSMLIDEGAEAIRSYAGAYAAHGVASDTSQSAQASG